MQSKRAILESMKKVMRTVVGTRAAGVYILMLAVSIAIGTFIENDYGTSSAQKLIYKAGWFTALLILFSLTLIANIIRFRMIQQKKWALFTFHAAIVVILIGAGVTRYLGFEGVVHIRENGTASVFLSDETYLRLKILKEGQVYEVNEPVLFSSLGSNKFKESYLLGNDLIEVSLKDFIANPKEILKPDTKGKPVIKIVFAGAQGREEYYLEQGQTRHIRNVLFNFNEEPVPEAVNIAYTNGELRLRADRVFVQTVMATRQTDTLFPGPESYPMKLRAMYTDGMNSFVFGDFNQSGIVQIESESKKVKSESLTALKVEVKVNGNLHETMIYGKKGLAGNPAVIEADKIAVALYYGSVEKQLPFSLKLYDFIMERYPGTNNPASYASEVQLIDHKSNLKKDYRIYMNHVLDYKGYRFFQSSYDNDELGTYLSVNHDFWGTWISYTGYFLLTIGMIFSLLSKKSRFYKISQLIKELRNRKIPLSILVFTFLLFPPSIFAQKVIDQEHLNNVIDKDHAELFSRIVVQDQNGRMKPMHTLTREIMRKLTRKENFNGLNADQVILGMFANSSEWVDVPLIKPGKHEKLLKLTGVEKTGLAYKDFFGSDGKYLLAEEIRKVSVLQPRDRGVYEKELLKLDERVNILNMVFSGHVFKIIPLAEDTNNTWVSGHGSGHSQGHDDHTVAGKFFSAYRSSLREALISKDYSLCNSLLHELSGYQKNKGSSVIPSEAKISTEILLNKLNVFNRLALVYVLLGLTFLLFLFLQVFSPGSTLSRVYKILYFLALAGFVFHTMGLGLRWYVSGRAPWSNGYESMIYIAWTTVLAGVLFTRKSFGGLAATMILSATILLVASFSYLDPEITPLVPVLKSYWLTIHVSMEAGSYGFLMLGAIIGLINIILMTFLTQMNHQKIYKIVKEMSYISEMTLIGGLFMISIGTYLGGVWANESWGRYWGWDAKETWALVTILVYAFILHMRLMPGLKSIYAFNVSTIFGLASVIMTYYGVNYYLSGLHSYAAGDPVPIPQWVYIATISIIIISILAFLRKRKFHLFN